MFQAQSADGIVKAAGIHQQRDGTILIAAFHIDDVQYRMRKVARRYHAERQTRIGRQGLDHVMSSLINFLNGLVDCLIANHGIELVAGTALCPEN